MSLINLKMNFINEGWVKIIKKIFDKKCQSNLSVNKGRYMLNDRNFQKDHFSVFGPVNSSICILISYCL